MYTNLAKGLECAVRDLNCLISLFGASEDSCALRRRMRATDVHGLHHNVCTTPPTCPTS